jgi:glycosyltransferase involved in cell wall biosynthesis/GT2 family glycosyltransferase
MRVAIIGTVGIPARYGGFETLAEQLAEHADSSLQITVYCSKKAYPMSSNTYKRANLVYLSLDANGVQSIFYDILSILHAIKRNDVLLILGVSGTIILPFVRLMFPFRKIITNIDGLEWKRDKWNSSARRFLKYSESLAIHYSDQVIADNQAIRQYVIETYGTNPKLIAYGANHCETPSPPDSRFAEGSYDFTVCRIEPENNIHLILQAYASMPDEKLVIVGNWQISEYGIQLRKQYTAHPQIYLLDPIYDLFELNKLRKHCRYYLHGHSAGGTNPSLVEAMYLNRNIIAFDVSYNRETTEQKATYFKNAQDLVAIVKSKSVNNALINAEIANKRYTWSVIAKQYDALYLTPKALNTNIKVSIITVVLNNQLFIDEAIRSVLSQSYSNIEYIVVDGGSTDGSIDIIKGYQDKISAFISEPDSGPYDAMNKGIEMATGEVIGFLHADDFYSQDDVIAKMVYCLQEPDTDSVYSDLEYVSRKDKNLVIRKWKAGLFNTKSFYKGWMPPHPTFFVKKSIYKLLGGYNIKLKSSADYELMLRMLCLHGIKAAYIPEVLVKMRVGGQSNRSFANRVKAHLEDRKVWKMLGLKPRWYTLWMKPLQKIKQYF